MKGKYLLFYFTISILCIGFSACKRKTLGCMDQEASNFKPSAQLSDGSCRYAPLIIDPDFEAGNGDWGTYTGTGFSPAAYPTSAGDGFMPTSGGYFLKCRPTISYFFGTLTEQFVEPNKLYKGFTFDYSYKGIAGADSILKVNVEFWLKKSKPGAGYDHITLWTETLSETPISFGGFPNIKVQKKDEYAELPFYDYKSELIITTSVSKGTFTFCIDNIREVHK